MGTGLLCSYCIPGAWNGIWHIVGALNPGWRMGGWMHGCINGQMVGWTWVARGALGDGVSGEQVEEGREDY